MVYFKFYLFMMWFGDLFLVCGVLVYWMLWIKDYYGLEWSN